LSGHKREFPNEEGGSYEKVLFFWCAFMLVAAVALAAGPKTYQVTGPVLEVKEM
jgi:hypothetical protein